MPGYRLCMSRSQPYRVHNRRSPHRPSRFFSAAIPRFPPSRARRNDPPPSTTSTRPSPGESTAAFTSELSSKHLMVLTGPLNFRTAPKSLKTGGNTRNAPELSFLWVSHKSQVANFRLLAVVMSRYPFLDGGLIAVRHARYAEYMAPGRCRMHHCIRTIHPTRRTTGLLRAKKNRRLPNKMLCGGATLMLLSPVLREHQAACVLRQIAAPALSKLEGMYCRDGPKLITQRCSFPSEKHTSSSGKAACECAARGKFWTFRGKSAT